MTAPLHSTHSRGVQAALGACVLLLALALAWGARSISDDAGYAGVGPSFLPWAMAAALGLCGALLLWQALAGGWAAHGEVVEGSGAARGDWVALAWVAAGIVANAALIETAGFVLSNALCYLLAVRGLRWAEGRRDGGLRQLAQDAAVGLAIAAPAFWLFTKFLAINLPGLTGSGWI